MTDRVIAVEGVCLLCGTSVLSTWTAAGDSLTIPAHTCEETS